MVGSPCRGCATWPSELRVARYAYVLDGTASELVHALKYEGWPELADPMAEAMSALDLPDSGDSKRVVTPVPTTLRRERNRGYNQAGLLARCLADRWMVPNAELLSRRPGALSQTSLSPSDRLANVTNAFSVRRDNMAEWQDAQVILVDDVLTTGATAGVASRELVRAGADSVTLVAFARALPGADPS